MYKYLLQDKQSNKFDGFSKNAQKPSFQPASNRCKLGH